MKERQDTIGFFNGEVGITLGANYVYYTAIVNMTIVAVVTSPSTDDASATIDINDDGTGVITGLDLSDQNVPGTWLTPGYGGTNTPVKVAAGSLLSLDANDIDAGTTANVWITYLTGEVSV